MSERDRFIDNGDDTVSDPENGLMWTKTDSMNELKKWVYYIDAKDYARELREKKFAGYDDWRLPKYDELKTIYEESLSNKDVYDGEIHISSKFAPGGGFSVIAEQISGRAWTIILNLKDGKTTNSESLWTFSEATRAVRNIPKDDA